MRWGENWRECGFAQCGPGDGRREPRAMCGHYVCALRAARCALRGDHRSLDRRIRESWRVARSLLRASARCVQVSGVASGPLGWSASGGFPNIHESSHLHRGPSDHRYVASARWLPAFPSSHHQATSCSVIAFLVPSAWIGDQYQRPERLTRVRQHQPHHGRGLAFHLLRHHADGDGQVELGQNRVVVTPLGRSFGRLV
jgi:hypothetical protein